MKHGYIALLMVVFTDSMVFNTYNYLYQKYLN